ncbi:MULTISPECIES: RNase adapter RapZ [Geobacter]|uniref:GlmZ(SRNA)-inactivating NTPase n=2 Tax=Geobacter TaxID=28231 RepID=A0A0C1QN86_9BACT|nr:MULTISPECIES: RNase adapter RapZ [Geobacter]ANA40172.1 RNase adaptor protein RapZ [Geobacter anodireducens]KIE42072.1 glmZ(sRNA)-inactivating NTPase [Geobacter soli]MBE2886673.1 RNase adapter RapZ [Geobacter anodireducens]HMN03127.1 RNase adapter RapZ [Geobacter anodireducens]
MRVLVITGLSGSGKSTAVRVLEDEGFFCVDNLPVLLFPTIIDLVCRSGENVAGVALVMDIRGRDFIKGFENIFQQIDEAGHSVEVIFFDATDEVLVRRFSETRRRHPALESGSVPEGIRYEREQLAGLRRLATHVIDTSELNVHQLKELVHARIKGESGTRPMTIHLQSFGYRFGIPLESDIVMDVRFLPNPHFVPELKPGTGLDENVRTYVLEKQETRQFLERFKGLLEFLVPSYQREGKSYLTVSVGCTGGRHRSVAIVEELRTFFAGLGLAAKVSHRDKEKG